MKIKNPKILVIDVSVTRSAGGEDATSPISTDCRDFLFKVYEICHRAVSTFEISEEWKGHKSRFFINWKRWMRGQKKINDLGSTETENKGLRDKIEQVVRNENHKEEILKDIHLIEAALATNQIVISRDDTMDDLRKKYQDQIPEFKKIVWVNPTKNPKDVIKWLEAGANPKDAPNQ